MTVRPLEFHYLVGGLRSFRGLPAARIDPAIGLIDQRVAGNRGIDVAKIMDVKCTRAIITPSHPGTGNPDRSARLHVAVAPTVS